tara:strand:+ start:37 stop:345 length:309 start_codon:yes stop_codon:yes gene_type:complete
MNLNINNICGESDGTFDLSSIANDPNFIFENDPNFEALKLYNSDGDAIFVNSWVECANYVSGGWSNIISSNHDELFFYFLSSLLLGYFFIKRYLSKKEKLSN